MLRLPKWLAYRDKVLEHLETLLVLYPRGRQFAADFPGLPAAIRGHFDEAARPEAAALALAAAMIGRLVGQLDPAGRAGVAARLAALGLEDIEPLVARHISRHPDRPADAAGFALRLVGGALLMARRMAEDGLIDRREHRAFLEALDGALLEGSRLGERFGLAERG